MSRMEVQPPWLYELVYAVERYEEEHGRREDGWPCLNEALVKVPAEVRNSAKVWHAAVRQVKEESDDAA